MLFSVVGMADSGFLFWRYHLSAFPATDGGKSSFCPANGCDIVNQGEYAKVKGIPVAAFGAAGYLALLALAVVGSLGHRRIVGAIIAVSGTGVGVSAYLVYLQVAVIRAICFWCVLSVFTMASIFFLSVLLRRQMRSLEPLQSAGQQGL